MKLKNSIKVLANQCVKCNVCSPYCPTYVKTQHEGESARGRIALMEGLASERLVPTATLLSHLDSCLYCRSCEAVCPSDVAYGKLLALTQQWISKKNSFSPIVDFLFRNPILLQFIARLLKFYQLSGLRFVLHKTKLLSALRITRFDHYLPSLQFKRWKTFYPSRAKVHGTVNLFVGCISPFVESRAIAAAIQLLTIGGWNVRLPNRSHCCGAFHMHAGSPHFAKIAKTNSSLFNSNEPILFIAMGCGMILKAYSETILQTEEKIEHFSKAITDIFFFLSQHQATDAMQFKPLTAKVAVHFPCSQENYFKTNTFLLNLLKRIPDIELFPLRAETRCCGAAGLNMFTHPKVADELAADLINEIERIQPDYLLSANVGCRLHLAAQMKNKKIKMMHPLELLSMQVK